MSKKRPRMHDVYNPEQETLPDLNSKAEKERKKLKRSAILAWTAGNLQYHQENPHRNTVISSDRDKQRRRGSIARKAINEQLEN
ncbi:MAG: hypothetical protein WAW80_04750 [Candidatus Saccharimonadales bacterium]